MPHVVALQGHTGLTGTAAFKALLVQHDAGRLTLVVIHRPGSDTSMVPSTVETRELDLSKPDEAKIRAAVKGLSVYISLVSVAALSDQVHLFKPLSETSGFVTYFSPVIGNPMWTSTEPVTDERLMAFLGMFASVAHGPREIGIGMTAIQTGVFADYFMLAKYNYLGTDTAVNRVRMPQGGETRRLAIVTPKCLGEAIAEIVIRPPESIKNKDFYAFDYFPTGNEIVHALTALHGSAPEVVPYTEADYNADIDSKSIAMSQAVYRKCWSTGDWKWRGERLGPESKDFDALAMSYK